MSRKLVITYEENETQSNLLIEKDKFTIPEIVTLLETIKLKLINDYSTLKPK
jgi:hypothetical protein